VPKVTEIVYRHVGYFPTVVLSKVLNLWENDLVRRQIPIWKLVAERDKGRHWSARNPLPYIEVRDEVGKIIRIDYHNSRHGNLDVGGLKTAVAQEAIGELVVKEVAVGIPKDLITTGKRKQEAILSGDRVLAATFVHHYVDEGDKRRDEISKVSKDEIKDSRFKHSCLDLHGLTDTRLWRKGHKRKYDVTSDIELIRLVMRAVDPDDDLGMWAQYRREKQNAWVFVTGGSIVG
jgi:hypothetical protein